jgi:hypothetical protein
MKKKTQDIRPGDIVYVPIEARSVTFIKDFISIEDVNGNIHKLYVDQELDVEENKLPLLDVPINPLIDFIRPEG